jgi:hypothetical protein
MTVGNASESPVFVISTGRSGSTLLQRLLNCHPDLVVWGEHHGFLEGFALPLELMRDGGDNQFPLTPEDNRGPGLLLPTLGDPLAALEWSNPRSHQEFFAQAKAFIQDYFGSRLAPEQRWGFKEVRYNNTGVLHMLRDMFPAGRFIFMQRNPMDVACSKTLAWGDQPGLDRLSLDKRLLGVNATLADVRAHYAIQDEFAQENPRVSHLVRFEDILKSPRATMEEIMTRLELDASRYDWALSGRVLDQVSNSSRSEASPR